MSEQSPSATEIVQYPLLPLRDVVVFPHMVIPLFVGRPKSIKAMETAMEAGKSILLVAQKSAAKDDPGPGDMYSIGCVSNILQMLKLPDGTVKVLVEGGTRAHIRDVVDVRTHWIAEASAVPADGAPAPEVEALRRALLSAFDQYVKLNKKIPPEILTSLSGIDEAGRLADTVAAHLPLKLEQKQQVLEMFDVKARLEHLLSQLETEIDILQVEKRIRGRVKRQMEKSQREYYLNEQVKAIQKELGEGEEGADLEEKVKERIVEYLAVQTRVDKMKAPILCLVGAPGVGKTSLGQSIARATNRKFIRMSLGGVRDEAEIRGHRRTYIGSMPGKILQNMSRVGVRNPLFLLDEVDKMGMDFRGDPSSALLEVLDPEQNHTFTDHYVEVEYDLSEVMFVATANTLNIPPALLDRMEVIRISGYTEDEKVNIASRYLLPKQLKNNGLKKEEVSVSEAALRDIIRYFTREAGVRSLEREISKICRKVVKLLITKDKEKKVLVTPKSLDKFLGVRRFSYGIAEKKNQVGQVTGLAWTEVGGELLTIEAVTMPGKGKTITTGKLGEVMQESIQAALSVVRNRSSRLGVAEDFYQKNDIHVHLPEGATPKDGPSAGIGICTAMVSVLTGIPVRADLAMTGEITLRGEVLVIGGLKEKLLAAHRGGIKTVLIPEENVKDLAEIPDNIKNRLEILPVKWMDQVLELALEHLPEPRKPTSDAPPVPPVADDKTSSTVVTH